jgi:Fibronectin type III domain
MSTDAPASAPDPLPMQGTEDAEHAEDARLSGPAETVSGSGADEAVSGEDVPSAAAEQPFALVAPPPPPRRRRRPPKWLLPLVGGVLAAALVAGLLVWQPWSPRPIAPVSLTAESPTGTSVQLSWPAPNGGATPDHYVILRDGAQVAEVPGDERSWTNTGLRPGDKFQYEVATRGGGRQSGPSPAATVTTLAPSPVGLKVASTYTSATLTWKPSPLGPAPDQYVVYDQGERAATLDGATTSYVERGLLEGTAFQYTVVAEWGKVSSAPSATDSGTIRLAPLNNVQNVTVTTTSIPSGATGGTVGRAFPTSWNFTPQCAANACTMTVNLLVPGPAERGFPLTVKVTPSGVGYTGSTQAKFAECGGTLTTDAIKLTLVPDKSQISNGQWGQWTGTVVATAPYINLNNGYYCPSGSWDFKVSSGGAGNAGATGGVPV